MRTVELGVGASVSELLKYLAMHHDPHILIRSALPTERSSLEALQWRASLANPGDRDALLAHPDAIVLPAEQIADGDVFVAQRDDVILGFAAILMRPDGDADLDALFVDPALWRRGVGRLLVEHCATVARDRGWREDRGAGPP